MIDWNRDGRIDASEAAFTAYLMQMELEASEDDGDFDAEDDWKGSDRRDGG